jgi:hypothetical protein
LVEKNFRVEKPAIVELAVVFVVFVGVMPN